MITAFFAQQFVSRNVYKAVMGNLRRHYFISAIWLLIGLWLTAFGISLAGSEGSLEGLLLSPAKGSIIYTDSIYFDWNDVSGANLYEFQIDNEENFSSPLVYYQSSKSFFTIYIDVFPEPRVYYWRIRSRFYDGGYYWGEWTRPWYFFIPDQSTDATDNVSSDIPRDFELKQNYPNPFNPTTIIGYYLPRTSAVRLDIYDILGRDIKTVDAGTKKSGYQQVIWDGTDRDGNAVASGIYFYRLQAGEYTATRKMQLLK
jgi:hypothetical protein